MHPAIVSIASGGLVFRALRRVGAVAGDAVRPGRSILLLVLLCWVPLAILALLDGTFMGRAVEVPFLRDPAVHARLLVSLPLLMIGEASISRAAQAALAIIRQRGLVTDADLPALDAAVARVERDRDSLPVELLVLALTIAALWASRGTLVAERVLPHTSWLGAGGTGPALSRAGWWYFVVSSFVATVIGLRWVWWIFIWTRFVAGFLRRHLVVSPGHPDGHGGLAFLTLAQGALAPVLAALGANVAGRLGYEMLYDGVSLKQVQVPIVVVLVVAALVMFLPLLLFASRLAPAKRRALIQYDALGQQLVTRFEQKWLGAERPDEAFLESSDPSTYTDFTAVYGSLRQMSPTALDVKRAVGALLVVAVPFLPLLLMEMSLKEIAQRMLKLLM